MVLVPSPHTWGSSYRYLSALPGYINDPSAQGKWSRTGLHLNSLRMMNFSHLRILSLENKEGVTQR